MRPSTKAEDIYEAFNSLAEVEIYAATAAIKVGQETDQLMGQGYILAIERCRNILRLILREA